jgi:hypothetical protein
MCCAAGAFTWSTAGAVQVAFVGENALDKLPADQTCAGDIFKPVAARIMGDNKPETEAAAAEKVVAKVRHMQGFEGDETCKQSQQYSYGRVHHCEDAVTCRLHIRCHL